MSGWVDKDAEGGLLGKGMQKTVPVKHEKDKKHVKPETTGVGEGTAKRNIARKSRDPERDKAQGGGHKGLWRTTDDGTEGDATAAALDRDDPNYDSSEDAELVMVDVSDDDGFVQGYRASVSGPVTMALSEFKAKATETVKELFVSEDLEDAKRSVQELKSPMYHYELVKRAISLSLDQKERERELVSRLLSSLYPSLLTSDMVGKGFERLFETVDDLALDAPNAVRDVATFLARAVVDEILPPSFLSDPMVQGLGGEVVEHAKLLLSRDHMGARLERVWGPGDGRPVEELKVAIDQLLEEYLLSRQLEEAARCVRELSVPHFHHEIVKRAVVTALDKAAEDQAAMSSLLAYLHANEVVSEAQLGKGFRRLLQLVPDLLLDVPAAPAVLQSFIKQAKADGLLPPSFPEDRESLNPKDDDDDDH